MSENIVHTAATRARLRDLGIVIGGLPTGAHNAITDVPGVRVGHCTLVHDQPRVARTGVTVILPRADTYADQCFAGCHSFNGYGEMTGAHWLAETGLLVTPVAITNTHQVGVVRDALVEHVLKVPRHAEATWLVPVVAETYDGWLNDIDAFHLTKAHVFAALAAAAGGPVAEGCVGGGTGMMCHDFKGGIGTASRVIQVAGAAYTLGTLVQANYGRRSDLRVDGVPVGKLIPHEQVPIPRQPPAQGSSIIAVVATDAPLLPLQCRRLAERATIGLARVGGLGLTNSGDIFLCFSTGNHVPPAAAQSVAVQMAPQPVIDLLIRATVEAVEESILNALTAATTTSGREGHVAHALPLDELLRIYREHRPKPAGPGAAANHDPVWRS